MHGIEAIRTLYTGMKLINSHVTENLPIPTITSLSPKMEKIVARAYSYNHEEDDMQQDEDAKPLAIIQILNVNADNEQPYMLITVDDNSWMPYVDQYINDQFEPSYVVIISDKYFDPDHIWDAASADIWEIIDVFRKVAAYDVNISHQPNLTTMVLAQEPDYIDKVSSYDVSIATAALYYANKSLDMWIKEPIKTHNAMLEIVADFIKDELPHDTESDKEYADQCIDILDAAFYDMESKSNVEIVHEGLFNVRL